MHLAETPEQEALRQRAARILRPTAPPRGPRPAWARTARAIPSSAASSARWAPMVGSDSAGRWSTAARDGPATDQFILFDEVQRAHAPFPFVTINTVGPTLIAYGTAEQKATYLPGILAGELNFAIGYTEPEAGTDLASLRTTRGARRRRVGHQRQQGLHQRRQPGRLRLARVPHRSRTRPSTRASRSSSCPPTSPGFTWTPIVTVGGNVTTATYYSDVRVPLRQRRRRGQPRVAADHHAAQPRARRARGARPG